MRFDDSLSGILPGDEVIYAPNLSRQREEPMRRVGDILAKLLYIPQPSGLSSAHLGTVAATKSKPYWKMRSAVIE